MLRSVGISTIIEKGIAVQHATMETRPATPPRPREVYERVVDEGRERMGGTFVQIASRALIAGSTILLGIIALGIVERLVGTRFGTELGILAGSMAFGLGVAFLVIGRSDLFTENFLDPVAAAHEDGGGAWRLLGRLWVITLVFNLIGGAVLALLLAVERSIPHKGHEPLVRIAEETIALPTGASFVRAIAAGVLLTLLTWLVQAAPSDGSRIFLAWAIGSLVALGPFNHVVVTELHLLIGQFYGANVEVMDHLRTIGLATVGNIVGGVGFVTLTHLGQVKGES